MRESYAHEVELFWVGSEDERAPGGAITVELCGALEHEPPCPVAAHHTAVVRRSMALEVRVLFACEPGDEQSVRERIDVVLARDWQVLASRVGVVRDDEADHVARLVAS
jgi:hypothetical protein